MCRAFKYVRVSSYKPVPKLQEAFSALRHSRFHSEYYNCNLFGTLCGIKDKQLTLKLCLSVRALPSVIICGRLICLIFVNFDIGVIYISLLSKFDFNENRPVTVIFYIGTSMSFCPFPFYLYISDFHRGVNYIRAILGSYAA
jgi:hypothetical protein